MKFKNKNGITLIALVVSIIVLLILAGVSISMLTGQNGILNRAAEAKEKTEIAQRDEQAQLADLESLIENGGESVYDTTSGANKPVLTKGMIPVKWDTSKAKWVICTKNDSEWYNYNEDKNQWANVMLCDGTYNESTAVGTEVEEEDLGSMFVWIPRFAYKITKGYHESPEGGMDVKFLIGRTDKTEDGAKIVDYNATTTNNYSKFPDGYVVHPAFKDGSSTGYSSGEWKSEVLGIWVAKFQAGIKTTDKDKTDKVSNSNSTVNNYYYPVFKGRKFGYNYVSESQCYDLSLALDDASNPYGLTSSANSHLMKSSEWGAAAYLSMSQYGYSKGTITTATEKARNNLDIGGTVKNPNSSDCGIYGITGYSAKEGKSGRNQQTNTTWASKDTVTNTEDDSLTSYAWTVVNSGKDSGAGTKSSTTGNIYGVFDMSCGLAEYTAAYVNNSSGTGQGSAFATGTSTYLATAYPNKATTNIDFNSAYKAREFCPIYGDAIWETSSNVGSGKAWFGDTQEDDTRTYPEVFVSRGGSWAHGCYGLCGLYDANGIEYSNCGFRSVLVVE